MVFYRHYLLLPRVATLDTKLRNAGFIAVTYESPERASSHCSTILFHGGKKMAVFELTPRTRCRKTRPSVINYLARS